jgi:hypothetical protein
VTRQLLGVLAACTIGAGALGAQVGYDPARSPFRDLDFSQELTFYSGYYKAKKDPAQVAPRSGPVAGVHYEWRAGGPVAITADLSRLATDRRVLDPEAPAFCNGDSTRSCKIIDDFRWPLYFADLGMALNLTGARSFYRLVPQLKGGIGLVSDFHTKADVGDFSFGTRFAFHWGAGIAWVPGGPLQFRLDFMNHLYSLKYPELYYQPAEDNSRILSSERDRSVWLNNPSLTLGFSYLFSR